VPTRSRIVKVPRNAHACGVDGVNALAVHCPCDYDRSSMIDARANGKLPSAIIRPFAIVAPHAR
jgi:hypothetical protein